MSRVRASLASAARHEMDERYVAQMEKRIAEIVDEVLTDEERRYQAGESGFNGPLRPLDFTCYAVSRVAAAAYEAGLNAPRKLGPWRDAKRRTSA